LLLVFLMGKCMLILEDNMAILWYSPASMADKVIVYLLYFSMFHQNNAIDWLLRCVSGKDCVGLRTTNSLAADQKGPVISVLPSL
jgi:hypothetical protein